MNKEIFHVLTKDSKKHFNALFLKGVILLLCLVMMFSLVGCGNNEENGSNNSSSEAEDDYLKGYSQLVKSIAKDATYNELIANAGNINEANFDPHPYTFLAGEGHDVVKIKNGEIECTTQSWFYESEPNTLYVSTRVADPTNTYYTNYILTTTLSDDEASDYKSLYQRYTIEASFLNDGIAKGYASNDFAISSKTYVKIGTYQTLLETLEKEKFLGNSEIDISITGYNLETELLYITITPSIDEKGYGDSYIKEISIKGGLGQSLKFTTMTDGTEVIVNPKNAFKIEEKGDNIAITACNNQNQTSYRMNQLTK